jgi:hypothetical protein
MVGCEERRMAGLGRRSAPFGRHKMIDAGAPKASVDDYLGGDPYLAKN